MVNKTAKKAQKEAKAARRSREHQFFQRSETQSTGFKGFNARPSVDNQWGSGPSSNTTNLRYQGIQFVSGGKLSQLSDDKLSEKNGTDNPNELGESTKSLVTTSTPDQSQFVDSGGLPAPATAQMNPVESSESLQQPSTEEDGRVLSLDGPTDTQSAAKMPEDEPQRPGSSSSSGSEVIVFRGKARAQANPQPSQLLATRTRQEDQPGNDAQYDQNNQPITEIAFRLRPEAQAFVSSATSTPPTKSDYALPKTDDTHEATDTDKVTKPSVPWNFQPRTGADQDSATSDDVNDDLQDYIDNITEHYGREGGLTDDDEDSSAFKAGVSRSLTRETANKTKVTPVFEVSNNEQEHGFESGHGQSRPLSDDEENAETIRKVSNMADEEIARLLNKQASLGMANDKLILDSENLPHDDDDGFVPFSTKAHTSNRTRSKRNSRAKKGGAASFPDAEALADALDADPYGGFDVMDFDRPSLKAKKTGRKSNPPAELSDEELSAQMQATWQKDREKKAEWKKEREILRAQLNLSGKIDPFVNQQLDSDDEDPDLDQYIFAGSDIESVKVVIRRFLVDHAKEELALPIMNAEGREQVHRLAKALQLKSQSRGKDPARYVVLFRLTYYWNLGNINEVDALMAQRRYSDRRGGFNKQNYTNTRGRKGRDSAVRAKATYQDGDVVGASAPELGSDNRGRAMLEKMGWSQGMGIGREGKEGNVDSIKHIVKTTRAGLG